MSTFRRANFSLRHQKIVLFGDSLTQRAFELGGWGAKLANRYARRADVLNRGLSGYNSRWAVRTSRHAIPKDAQLLVLWFGANDAVLREANPQQYVTIEEYQRNMRQLVKTGRKKGSSVIVLTPPPVCEISRLAFQQEKHGPLFNENKRVFDVTGQYAHACREMAEEIDVPCVDMWAQMQTQSDWRRFLCDGLHLSPEGHQFTYDCLVGAIARHHPALHVELPSEDCNAWHRVERSSSQIRPWLPDSADIDELARESWGLPDD